MQERNAFPNDANSRDDRDVLALSINVQLTDPQTQLAQLVSESATHTMSLADYLAKNYLSADSDKKSKKRKRKNKDGGLKIDEDDISGWNKGDGSDDEDAPTIGS